ncbi:flagellar protein FlaI [Methanomicrobium sp. W14]|uniref:type II/IV secretion system ATPase subunit n=1 Tax=Methanomicrobium sp. W14 TaxID=2817839 RepID=UPI001FD9E4C2|nr:type II/IV secretion system ATPase subunit [Methanomicrobium sp. W14]MBP2134411.1 flagellar protein FlaI [Methanomicrobium sp. W14]
MPDTTEKIHEAFKSREPEKTGTGEYDSTKLQNSEKTNISDNKSADLISAMKSTSDKINGRLKSVSGAGLKLKTNIFKQASGETKEEDKIKKKSDLKTVFGMKTKKETEAGKTGVKQKFDLKKFLGFKTDEDEEELFHKITCPLKPEIKPGQIPDSYEILDTYWLNPPEAYAVIVKDEKNNNQYLVFEPKITEKDLLILEETDSQLRSILLYDSKVKKENINLDFDLVGRIAKSLDPKINDERVNVIYYYLRRNFNGYGKLDPLMHDENIEDITCNGPDIPVFIFHRKYSNLPVNIIFETRELNKYVLKIAQKADKQLSLTAPLVDAALPEGARAQITYTDVVSSKGSSFTIRKFKADPMTPVDLIDYGTYDPEILAFIWLCVENRKSAIVVGGTASGKTSMMNAFSLFIPHFAKIVSIEDTREIQMPHKNWLPMKTRESASESGKGNVDMFSLLKTALRQRPEYIIVGEVRGAEAQTLFQAMNTGHTTYSTLHAGGVEQAINRLTTNPINVPVAMFGALDLFIIQQLQYIGGRMVRRCITIDEVIAEKGDIRYNVLYKWNPVEDSFRKIYTDSKIINDISYSHGWTKEETLKQIEIRKKVLEGLLKHGVRRSDEITAVFDEFTKSGKYEFEE